MTTPNPEPAAGPSNFVRDIVLDDLKTNKYQGRVHTRFPPEPNGYLHIGHAKSICLNFGLAAEFGGKTNLRFDDTNPEKEETEYVDSIIENVRWLGFDWEDRLFYASDYFQPLYDWAVRKGQTYGSIVIDLERSIVIDLLPDRSAETFAQCRAAAGACAAIRAAKAHTAIAPWKRISIFLRA